MLAIGQIKLSKTNIYTNHTMGILKNILLEIPVFLVSLVFSILVGVLFFPNISDFQRVYIAIAILSIMVSTAQPAIWKKGFFKKSDRIFSFLISSTLGIFIYLSLEVLAEYLFWSTQFAFNLQVGDLFGLIVVGSGPIFCNYHLTKTAIINDTKKKEEEIIYSRTVSSKCPDCGYEYTNFDYREDAKEWICSQCKAKLPKI